MATLAELRARKGAKSTMPTHSVRITLDQDLLAAVERLESEKRDLKVEDEALEEKAKALEEGAKETPRKRGAPARTEEQVAVDKRREEIKARRAEIKDELAALFADLRESEGELVFRAMSPGKWAQWKNANQPRIVGHQETKKANGDVVKGDPIYHPDDLVLTRTVFNPFPVCNADALAASLGEFAVSWNGEEFADGDWDGWFAEQIAPGDVRDIVAAIVWMQERSGVRAPKAQNSPETPSV